MRNRPFHPSRPDLVRPVRVDERGIDGPTSKSSRGPRWRRTSRGFFVPADVERTTDQRIVEAAAAMPDRAAVTGWAALRWCGARWFDGLTPDGGTLLPITIASCDQDIRRQDGFTLCQERLNPAEIVELNGLRVCIPVRSVFFEMRYASSVREGVVPMDMTAYADLVSVAEAREYVLAHPGWTGVPQARDVLALANENSWSPWETRLRMVWVRDAGLAEPLTNQPVFDRQGRHLGTPDLLDPDAGLAVDYDGVVHLAVGQRRKDLVREHAFREHGLEYLTVVGGDMHDRASLADRLVQTRERAIRTPRTKAWTLTPPVWWQRAETVAQRRSLTGSARVAVQRLRQRLVA